MVDPNAESRDKLCPLLHKMGLQVSTCASEDDALEQLARVRFAAVLRAGRNALILAGKCPPAARFPPAADKKRDAACTPRNL